MRTSWPIRVAQSQLEGLLQDYPYPNWRYWPKDQLLPPYVGDTVLPVVVLILERSRFRTLQSMRGANLDSEEEDKQIWMQRLEAVKCGSL